MEPYTLTILMTPFMQLSALASRLELMAYAKTGAITEVFQFGAIYIVHYLFIFLQLTALARLELMAYAKTGVIAEVFQFGAIYIVHYLLLHICS